MYEYGSLDSPDGEVEGVKVGDIVDYMPMVITRIRILMELLAVKRLIFENLPKSKYAPLPWKINDELNEVGMDLTRANSKK